MTVVVFNLRLPASLIYTCIVHTHAMPCTWPVYSISWMGYWCWFYRCPSIWYGCLLYSIYPTSWDHKAFGLWSIAGMFLSTHVMYPASVGLEFKVVNDVLILWHWPRFDFFHVDFHQPSSLWGFPSSPNHLCTLLPFPGDLGWMHVGCSSAYWSVPTGVVHCLVVDFRVQALLGHLMYLLSGGWQLLVWSSLGCSQLGLSRGRSDSYAGSPSCSHKCVHGIDYCHLVVLMASSAHPLLWG